MNQYRVPLISKIKGVTKRILKSLVVGRLIYPVVQKAYRSYAIPMRRRRLHKFGYEGYVSTEYEGNRWILPGNEIPEKEQVTAHQKHIQGIIKELEA